MIQNSKIFRCCGCEACVQICPKHCISLIEDSEGFSYPNVEKDKCINCKLCEEACPLLCKPPKNNPIKIYAVKNLNEGERINSSSGGLFIILAKHILALGGVVFGARFDENGNVLHDFAETESRVSLFVGSKYVQSRIGDSFIKCRSFLQEGRYVLFSGTPCQIAALKNFLRREYDKLITIDLICHGVSSPKVWQSYLHEFIHECELNYNDDSVKGYFPIENLPSNFIQINKEFKIIGISFKNKSYGWKNNSLVLSYLKKTDNEAKKMVYLPQKECDNPYMRAYICDWISRPSCYSCIFKGGVTNSDMTIGDFWGVEKQIPNIDDDKGVSLLVLNTKKGESFFEAIDKSSYLSLSVSLENAMKENPSFFYPSKEPNNRKLFFELFTQETMSINEIVVKLSSTSPLKRICLRIVNKLVKLLQNHSKK